MRICHVAAAMKGGSEVIVSQLARSQVARGDEVSVVYSSVRESVAEFAPLFPKGVTFIPWEVGRDVSLRADYDAYRQLHAILRQLKPSIVHLHNAKAGAHGRLASYFLKIPNIYSPHGLSFLRSDTSALNRAAYYTAEWILALFGDVVVASSRGEYQALTRVPGRKALVNNGLDVDAVVTAASGNPVLPKTDKFRLVIVGRIEEQKNPALVAQIVSACPKEWEWIWVGEGSMQPVLAQTGRVNLVGWLPRDVTLATVRSADVFVQASRWEGMSFALLEAMALGRVCVVSDVPGNRDLVTSEVSGFTCNSLPQYVEALEILASDPLVREQLGAKAAQSIDEVFSFRAADRNWSELYASALNI